MDFVLKQSSCVHREIRHFQSGHGPDLCMENFRQAFSYILSTNPSCVLSRRVQFNALWVAILGCLSLKTTLISVEFCKSSG